VNHSKTNPNNWQRWGKRFGRFFLILIPLLLLRWTFRQVPFDQVWATLRQLNVVQLAVWLLVNLGLLILMTGRWWLILRTLGHHLPCLILTRYRLGSFAISYFTPGPQFGGEPVQVLVLRQRHGIPGTTGTASVGLDKLLELIANFSFLVYGITVALVGAWMSKELRVAGLLLALSLLAFPLAYLILMLAGYKPLNGLMGHLPKRIAQNRFSEILQRVETEMSDFCVAYPRTVLLATLISLSVWVGMVFEYWLLTYFLGLRLSGVQTIIALTAARLAFLTPLPAGLGALEASQVLALEILGLDPSYGVSISLLIRLRDILFGLIGLLGVVSLLGWRFQRKVRNPKDV
jgi:uncharacterized protein (TIRG00374 family)